ncbi:MAG: EAL domain-containing protein [Bacillales bacterium]|nr:EAL domain-containing protein [Bacillales bacterium]
MEKELKETTDNIPEDQSLIMPTKGRKLFQKGNKEYLNREDRKSNVGEESSTYFSLSNKKPVQDNLEDNLELDNKENVITNEKPIELPQKSSGRKLFQKGNKEYLKKSKSSPASAVSSISQQQKVISVSRNKLAFALNQSESAYNESQTVNRPNLFKQGNDEYAKKGRKQRGQENRVDTHAKRGKEIIVDTRARDRARKRREELARIEKERLERERKQRELEARRLAFIEFTKKRAAKNNTDALRLQIKGKEQKVASTGEKEARERIKRAMHTPFTYYYNAAIDEKNKIRYINVNQIMNDKFSGRIFQPQYFAIAEQSDRIFEVNKLMLIQAIGQANLKKDVKFTVQVSPKWLEKTDKCDELKEMLKAASDNLIISMNAETLGGVGEIGKERIEDVLAVTKVSLMLDNVENETFYMILEYPVTYVRLDKRYYVTNRDKKEEYLKVIVDFCKRKKISLSAKYIDDEGYRAWFIKNGVTVCEGSRVQPQKFSITSYFGDEEKKEEKK